MGFVRVNHVRQMRDNRVPPETIRNFTIEELFNRWPQTAEVFQRYHMACVGCALASFCRVTDAIDTYHLAAKPFLAELEAVIVSDTGKNEV